MGIKVEIALHLSWTKKSQPNPLSTLASHMEYDERTCLTQTSNWRPEILSIQSSIDQSEINAEIILSPANY